MNAKDPTSDEVAMAAAFHAGGRHLVQEQDSGGLMPADFLAVS